MKKSKSTRVNRPVSNYVMFNQKDMVKSISIEGKEALMDVANDNGHHVLYPIADKDKTDVKVFETYKKQTDKEISDLKSLVSSLENRVGVLEKTKE